MRFMLITRFAPTTKLTFSRLLPIVFLLAVFLVFPSRAHAQPEEWASLNPECVGGADNDVATIQGISCLIYNIFSVALTVIGLATFAMFIYGGVKLMTAGSNAQGLDNARKTITFAIIGMLVALSAFIILNLISSFTGVTKITDFVIPNSEDIPSL